MRRDDIQLSAEIRWFWPESQAPALKDWFVTARGLHAFKAGGGSDREDVYLRDDGQDLLGIKRRGGKKEGIEVKGLVDPNRAELSEGPLRGPIQVWCKWTSGDLSLRDEPTIALKKTRWIRKFTFVDGGVKELELDEKEQLVGDGPWPDSGCNVEITRIAVIQPEGGIWSSLGLESFGTHETICDDLRRTAGQIRERNCPNIDSGIQASYPAWLNTCVTAHLS